MLLDQFIHFSFILQDIANVLGYDTTTNSNYWKDRVNLELSVAVLDSYKSATVAIVDHHSLVRINQNNMLSKGHSLCKHCLHDLQFIKKGSSSPNLSKLARADISCQLMKKDPCAELFKVEIV